jgi:hypothetical protein
MKFLHEPDIVIGKVATGSGYELYRLPKDTVLGHTLIISRSGGGKSHAMATIAYGLANTIAGRRVNLLSAMAELEQANPSDDLTGKVPGFPPLSLCVFDPHRDLAKRLLTDFALGIANIRLQRRLKKRWQDLPNLPNWENELEKMLIYLDLGGREAVFGLNLLDVSMWESKENCASTVIEIFKRIYPDSWGSRMEDCVRHAIFALYLLNTLRKPKEQFTITDLVPFVTIDSWRNALLAHPIIREENPAISSWWQIQFDQKMSDNFRNEVIKPVLNKFNPFISSDLLARIFGQPHTTLNFTPLLKKGSVILLDLAASEIETENCALAGAILISFLTRCAKQIASHIPDEADRPLIQMMVDEFNVILAAPYAEIMGQYRKWGVRATLATQSLSLIDKLDPTLKPLIMANCANLMVLQINAEDAEYLRRELVADNTSARLGSEGQVSDSLAVGAGGGGIGPDLYDLVNAERGMCYFKGTIGGIRRPVFTIRITARSVPKLPPEISQPAEQEAETIKANILARSTKLYTRQGKEISEWLNAKIRAYNSIHQLELPESSSLLEGFASVDDQHLIKETLNRHLTLGQAEHEIKKMRGQFRERTGVARNRQSNPPKTNLVPIPKYAPDYMRLAPTRSLASSWQAFKEGLRPVLENNPVPKKISKRKAKRAMLKKGPPTKKEDNNGKDTQQ